MAIISPLVLEHAVPLGDPVVVERYFVQACYRNPRHGDIWTDIQCDLNYLGGAKDYEAAFELMRTKEDDQEPTGAHSWRVIKRTFTITTENVLTVGALG